MKKSKAKADRYFSAFIRKRDEGKPCVTCGKYTDKKDCGHFISRRFESTRFDEQNSHGQCQKCNRFEYGNQYEHSLKIDQMYGKGTAESLSIKSKMLCKRNSFDYEEIAKYYREKIKKL